MKIQAPININRSHDIEKPTMKGYVNQKRVIELTKDKKKGWYVSYSLHVNNYPDETIQLLDAINETVKLKAVSDMIEFLNKELRTDK